MALAFSYSLAKRALSFSKVLLSIPFYLVGELPRVLASLVAPMQPRAPKRRRS